jgi:hypothetical protein
MAPQLRNEFVYDWLDGVFAYTPTPPAPPAPPAPPVQPTLAASGLDAEPLAAIAGGLATAGAGAAVLASRIGSTRRSS